MTNTIPHITRNNYGEINTVQPRHTWTGQENIITWPEGATPAPATHPAAWRLIARAVKKGIISRAYDSISWDRKGRADGSAIHHELYDSARGAALVCVRDTEGSKYGVHTTSKTYYLITSTGGKITAIEAPKSKTAKLAKSGLTWGGVIGAITGKKPAKIKTAATPKPPRIGYKIVAIDNGQPVSVYDGSPWPIGKTRAECARPDHNGGLYHYRTLADALTALNNNEVFAEAWQQGKRLAIAKIQAMGREISYAKYYSSCRAEKLAASKIKPLAIVASII